QARLQGNSVAGATREVGGVDQVAPGSVDLRDVARAAPGGVPRRVGGAPGREVGGSRGPGHVGIAGAVHGDHAAGEVVEGGAIRAAATEVGRVDQAAGGAELRHKGLLTARPVIRLKGTRGGREIIVRVRRIAARAGRPGYVGVAGTVHRDAR